MLTPIIFVVGAILLLFMGTLFILVEDWSRDLTTNTAETSETSDDPLLRPMLLHRPVAESADLVEHAVHTLVRWEIAGRDQEGNTVVVRLVRTTALWRFKDDITVRLEPVAEGTRVSARSQSRVGKGDLGQNPRNLRELFEALRTMQRISVPQNAVT
ncbi:MAG: DUF1499 domain-containing protein [Pirellulales bacterium]|nr:DUF1499 domain-containing protein [Pirellulales bacterium]